MTAPRILVLRALGMGDLLTAVPALRGLARARPEHRLLLATPGWLAPLVELIEVVDEHVRVGELEPLPAPVRGCDLAVNLHGSGPQSHELLLATDPDRLLAFRHPAVPASHDAPAWDPESHEVARWCQLLAHDGIEADPGELDLAPPRRAAPVRSGVTVVHPGAKAASRRWPPERYAAVAAAERAAGREVVVTGSTDEQVLAGEVASRAQLPRTAVLAGTQDLHALAATIAVAGRIVCGDTGVAHLATAMGTPSVVLFGPTPPSVWGPPDERRDRHRVLWAGHVGDPLADRSFHGLDAIGVDDVLAALRTLHEGQHLPGTVRRAG